MGHRFCPVDRPLDFTGPGPCDTPMRRRGLVTFGAAVVLGAGGVLATAWAGPSAFAAGTFNVKDFGATGNGSSIDSNAVNKAIAAANAAGGGTVVFPSGTYKSHSIHLKSNVTLQLDAGATIRAAS